MTEIKCPSVVAGFIAFFGLFTCDAQQQTQAQSKNDPSQFAPLYEIEKIKIIKSAPRDGICVWQREKIKEKLVWTEVKPCLEVTVSTSRSINPSSLFARCHLYSPDGKLISSLDRPSPAGGPKDRFHYAMPVIFKPRQRYRIFFEISPSFLKEEWKCIVVFGDNASAVARGFPKLDDVYLIQYPERQIVESKTLKESMSVSARDPLIEQSIKTQSAIMPEFTLLLRMPKGIDDPKHIKGILAYCGSAQWAHRLCLRKPEYFQAIYMHVPGSFDVPRQEANRVLWCLTTGELYAGYERANQFVTECRALGFPFIYKAFPEVGHDKHPDAGPLSFAFFRYALSLCEARNDLDARQKSEAEKSKGNQRAPWPKDFQEPPLFGDMLNNRVLSISESKRVPPTLLIPLPNKEIADIWGHSSL